MILTSVGIAKLINATLTSVPLDITHMAVGDSGGSHYSPTQSATALKNEVWRGTVHLVEQSTDNPNWIVVEAVIPTTVGGFTARELGLIDAEGDLIAIGKIPETYKPIMEEGSAKDLYLKAIIEASNASSVVMKVDPSSVIANRKYVDDKIQIVSTNLTSLETRVTEHLDQEATETILGHVKQSKNNTANTVVTRNANGTIKATGGTSTDEVLAVFWRGTSAYTASATLTTSAVANFGGSTYLLTVEIGVAAAISYHGMYLVHYQSVGAVMTTIFALNSEFNVTMNSDYTITIKSTSTSSRTIHASLVRVV